MRAGSNSNVDSKAPSKGRLSLKTVLEEMVRDARKQAAWA